MARVYLLLGGNLGNKPANFVAARARMSEKTGQIIGQSAIYETEPWGFESADIFWNQVLELETSLSPEEVLAQTQQIEKELGRIRHKNQYVSRFIDIDLLFYDNQIIQQVNLTIPHPRIQERKFTLVPLCEIAPGLVHPVLKKTIEQLLSECTDPLRVTRISESER
jgi:2-amino-4-hydroxy-6-hydroxymethyldihydropteridine diphosphokinase